MFCPKCGAKNADGAKFCQKCGHPLTTTMQPGNVAAVQPNGSYTPTGNANVPGQNGQFGPNPNQPGYLPAIAGSSPNYAFTKAKGKVPKPVLLGVVAAVAVLVVVFLVVPAISSPAGLRGIFNGTNGIMGKVMSGNNDALSSATKVNINNVPAYFSNQESANLIQSKISAAKGSYSSDYSDIFSFSDDEVKTLNGQWMLMNISTSGNPTDQSTGCIAYATVVNKTGLKAKDLAGYMDGAGLRCDHVVAASTDTTTSSQLLSNLGVDSMVYNAQNVCTAVGVCKDYMGLAISYDTSNYSTVIIFAMKPDFLASTNSSMSNFSSEYQQMVSNMYVR